MENIAMLGYSMEEGMLVVRFILRYLKTTGRLIPADPINLEDWRIEVSYTNTG